MVKLSNSAQGVLYATAAYVWWGFLPLFWAIFDPVGKQFCFCVRPWSRL